MPVLTDPVAIPLTVEQLTTLAEAYKASMQLRGAAFTARARALNARLAAELRRVDENVAMSPPVLAAAPEGGMTGGGVLGGGEGASTLADLVADAATADADAATADADAATSEANAGAGDAAVYTGVLAIIASSEWADYQRGGWRFDIAGGVIALDPVSG